MIKENESPGLDGLDISILKIPDYLLALFNRCLNDGEIPADWNGVLICLILKNNKDPYSPVNCRDHPTIDPYKDL